MTSQVGGFMPKTDIKKHGKLTNGEQNAVSSK